MVRNSSKRLAGIVRRDKGHWQKAYRHIAEHFRAAGRSVKNSHGVFARKFRSETEIKSLLRKVASGVSRAPVVSLERIGGKSIGRPVVLLQKKFSRPIGIDAKGKPADILVVVMDYTGRLLTAYPVSRYLTAGAGALSAAAVMSTVSDAYASETEARDAWYSAGCDPTGPVDWLIDFLVAPACIAQDGLARPMVEQRAGLVIGHIERKLRKPLDRSTRDNIRADVLSIWGY